MAHLEATPRQSPAEDAAVVAAARRGDKAAFTALAERYRRELLAYCYRMLGSFDDSQDLVQETLLKAWQNRARFEGRSSLRSWLYRIATNACLDFLRANPRTPSRVARTSDGPEPPPHVPWLEPFPDSLLEPMSASEQEPEARTVSKERIELAFLVSLQFLPPKQRAALILCEALDWSAKETASFLGLSVAAVNSALQRARATLREDPAERRPAPTSAPDTLRKLLDRYVDAHERRDMDGLAALLHDDLRFSMPPQPDTFAGRELILGYWVSGGLGSPEFGEMRCVVTRANRLPAVAIYVKKPGADVYHPLALDVLRIEGERVGEITTFELDRVREIFALPESLP